jgi:hypothetical protein
MAFNQRDGVLPADAHLGLRHWAALSAAALAVLFVALLASLRTTGFGIPAFSAAAAVLAWGIACLAYRTAQAHLARPGPASRSSGRSRLLSPRSANGGEAQRYGSIVIPMPERLVVGTGFVRNTASADVHRYCRSRFPL